MLAYNESEIIAQAKAGNSRAFCELVERYKEKALSVAYSFCANYEDAKDLSQEAFIKAFKSIKRFKVQSKFYTWFYRILVNICKDYLRRRKRNKFIKLSVKFKLKDGLVEPEDIFESVASSVPGPGQQLLDKELGAHLTKAITSLPEKQRTVFTLKNIQGLTLTEIAEISNSALGTVKANLFKATINLQAKLEEYINLNIPGGVK